MKILFNNHISQINVYEKSLHYSDLVFKRGARQVGTKFGIFPVYETVEGLFSHWSDDYWGTVEEYNTSDRNTYFEDGEFYVKPHCIIYTTGGKSNTVYFKTVKGLLNYVDELKSLAPNVILK
jgi:hypothetical protein